MKPSKVFYRIFKYENLEFIFDDTSLLDSKRIRRGVHKKITLTKLIMLYSDNSYTLFIYKFKSDQSIIFGQSETFVSFLKSAGVQFESYKINDLKIYKKFPKVETLTARINMNKSEVNLKIVVNRFLGRCKVYFKPSSAPVSLSCFNFDNSFSKLSTIHLSEVKKIWSGEAIKDYLPHEVLQHQYRKETLILKDRIRHLIVLFILIILGISIIYLGLSLF